ncbi:MAG: hypothetical protein IPH10_08315 [bacterium]|nr:hypothetical protein [bacterium]
MKMLNAYWKNTPCAKRWPRCRTPAKARNATSSATAHGLKIEASEADLDVDR